MHFHFHFHIFTFHTFTFTGAICERLQESSFALRVRAVLQVGSILQEGDTYESEASLKVIEIQTVNLRNHKYPFLTLELGSRYIKV